MAVICSLFRIFVQGIIPINIRYMNRITQKTQQMMKKLFTLLLAVAGVVPLMADKIEASVTLPDAGKPEHVYVMTSGNGVTSNALTAPTQTEANYGQFAFYAADGVIGAYYIYSHTAQKWVTYTKAASYNDGKNFVKMSDTKVDGAYFRVDNYSGDDYQLSPYTTSGVAGTYLNWHGGVSGNPYDSESTLGLYGWRWRWR